MTVCALALLGVSVALAAWSYLGYPALLRRLAARVPARSGAPDLERADTPSVDVLVSAADEQAVIGARVRNLLDQQVEGAYGVLIGCDGSRDGTAEAARAAAGGGALVHVTEFPVRRGKASVLNDLVAASRADVLVFTDANTRFDSGAVQALCRALSREAAGAACGRLVLLPADGSPTPEGELWDRETALKEAEGRLGICLGANGAIYAARREAVAPLPADTTSMDDFLIPLGIARRGARVVFARDAVAREGSARNPRAEASRRFRIGVGAGQVLRRERWLWNLRRYPRLGLAFFSRKVARWLAPVALLAGAFVALGSRSLWPMGGALLAVCLAVGAAARAGLPARGTLGRLYYFAVLNLAIACGVLAGLFGYSRPAWKSVARS